MSETPKLPDDPKLVVKIEAATPEEARQKILDIIGPDYAVELAEEDS